MEKAHGQEASPGRLAPELVFSLLVLSHLPPWAPISSFATWGLATMTTVCYFSSLCPPSRRARLGVRSSTQRSLLPWHSDILGISLVWLQRKGGGRGTRKGSDTALLPTSLIRYLPILMPILQMGKLRLGDVSLCKEVAEFGPCSLCVSHHWSTPARPGCPHMVLQREWLGPFGCYGGSFQKSHSISWSDSLSSDLKLTSLGEGPLELFSVECPLRAVGRICMRLVVTQHSVDISFLKNITYILGLNSNILTLCFVVFFKHLWTNAIIGNARWKSLVLSSSVMKGRECQGSIILGETLPFQPEFKGGPPSFIIMTGNVNWASGVF